MKFPILLKNIFLFLTTIATLSYKTSWGQDSSNQKKEVKEWLPVPFGTIVKMRIEIVDTEELGNYSFKCYPAFLFRVKSIDSTPLAKPIIIQFESSGSFPNNDFGLFKHLYKRDTGILNSNLIKEMKKEYVGKEFDIYGYETGAFRGIPNDYVKYCNCIPPQGCGFAFRHYIVIVEKWTIVSN